MPGKQGFASMSPEKRRAIASKGGKKAHIMLVAHRWTSEEARAAGRKGGSVCQARKRKAKNIERWNNACDTAIATVLQCTPTS